MHVCLLASVLFRMQLLVKTLEQCLFLAAHSRLRHSLFRQACCFTPAPAGGHPSSSTRNRAGTGSAYSLVIWLAIWRTAERLHLAPIVRTSSNGDTGAEECRLRGRPCPIGHRRLRLGRLCKRLRRYHNLSALRSDSGCGRSGRCDGHSLPTGFPEITFTSKPLFA